MNPTITGIIGIVVLILFFLIGIPVGFAMGIVGFLGFCYLVSLEPSLSIIAIDFWSKFSSYALTTIPMFVFMGSVAFASGMGERLYRSTYTIFGQLRGGLALATIGACASFAAISGSSISTAATMGKIALPEMKRYNYDESLSTGCVASAGTLGILIPPSTALIVYGILTEESIGELFVAGIIPGIILAFLFFIVVWILCSRKPALGPAGSRTSIREKIASLRGVVEMLILFGLVIGGLFAGWFTPTQSGAVGSAGALAIALVKRQLNWSKFIDAAGDAVRITCMVLVIVAGGTIFGHFMAITKIPINLAEWTSNLPFSPIIVMLIILLILLLAGFFMDSLALILLTIPIFYPAVVKLGFDPIWFGVIMVLVMEMGVITPPVGINVYTIKGVAPDVPLETIFRGIFPFLFAIIACAVLLIFFPQIATFLPSLR